MSKPITCPKCAGTFYSIGPLRRGILTEHDHAHHPTQRIVINDPRAPKPRTYDFPHAEILTVQNIARTGEGSIYTITLRANPNEDGIEMFETLAGKEGQ